MYKYSILLLIIVVTSQGVTGIVTHDISVQNQTVTIETDFTLGQGTEEQYNIFQASWQLPENAKIQSLRDSMGEITEYERTETRLEFETHSGDRRSTEQIRLTYSLPDHINETAENLFTTKIQLPGFPNSTTQAKVNTPEPLLGIKTNHGFQHAIHNTTANITGKGPLTLKLSYTSRTSSYEHFILWGDTNLSQSDALFPLTQAVTGKPLPYRKLAIIILPENEYEQSLDNAWYAGYYAGAGIIYIKKEETKKENLPGLIIHEAMHAFNEKAMNWVKTESTLLDEGLASFTEYLANKKVNTRQSEIFGEPVTWEAPCTTQPENDCRFSRDPRGTLSDLIAYYRNQPLNIFTWYPQREGNISSNTSLRSFGYAYADLMIRRYAIKNGIKSLPSLYSDISNSDVVKTPSSYEKRIGELFNQHKTPCKRDIREQVKDCIAEANSYDPVLPENIKLNNTTKQINLHPRDQNSTEHSNSSRNKYQNSTVKIEPNKSVNVSKQNHITQHNQPEKQGMLRYLTQIFMDWLHHIIS